MWRRGARVSWLSLKTKVDGLSVVWPQSHWDGLSVVWPQNHWDSFLWFALKTSDDSFSGLASKPVAMVSWLVEGFSVWASKSTALIW
jgi:hypothetical protein